MRRVSPLFFLTTCLLVLLSALAGCVRQEPSRVLAGEPPAGLHSVFVVARGYHTGLVLRARELPEAWPARGDFPSAQFLEFGWGAREYYPVDDPGPWRGIRVLFTRSDGAINVVQREPPLAGSLRDSEVVELRVTDEGYARMLQYLRQSYALAPDGRAIPVTAGVRQDGRFYASPLVFHALSNCNGWVARALAEAGVPIEHPSTAMTAGLLMRQVRAASLPRGANHE